MKTTAPQEIVIMPTDRQCDDQAEVMLPDGRPGIACWCPQLGGPSNRCILLRGDHILIAYIWKDHYFPYDNGQNPHKVVQPYPQDFSKFGQLVAKVFA